MSTFDTDTADETQIDPTFDATEFAPFKDVAAEPERLAPGRYIFRLPKKLVTEVNEYNGDISLRCRLNKGMIVADANGEPVKSFVGRFMEATTRPMGKGAYRSLPELVRLFGIDPTTLSSKSQWDEALSSIAGQDLPVPVLFGYIGSYKLDNGKKKYLYSKDFALVAEPTSGADYATEAWIINGQVKLTPDLPEDVRNGGWKIKDGYAKANGMQYVQPSFEVEFGGFAVKVK